MNYIEKPKGTYNSTRFLDYYLAGHKGFIAGGAFKNIFKKQKIKDLDIFFTCQKDFIEAVEYYKKEEDYVFSYENDRVSAFKNKKTNIRVELICQTFGSPAEIISMFDFSITKFAYARREEKEETVFYHLFSETFFEDLVNNKLVIDDKLLFPVSSFERSYRYRTYGYGLCKESKAKMIDALKTSDTDDLSNDLYFGID